MPLSLNALILKPLTSLKVDLLDTDLDGTYGKNRATEKPFIPVDHDLAAIEAWLIRVKNHTYRSYKREVERLLLWSIIQKQKPFSSLNAVDMVEYRDFLANPQPSDFWVSSRHGHTKESSSWRPFTGGLDVKSIRYAEIIINSLFKYLVDQRYLLHNPLSSIPKLKGTQQSMDVERSLTKKELDFVLNYLSLRAKNANKDGEPKWVRHYFMMLFLYSTGLRIHELAKAKLSDIKIIHKDDQQKSQYWLKVIGKGQKIREVPLSDVVIEQLKIVQEQFSKLTISDFSTSDMPLLPPIRRLKEKNGEKNNNMTTMAIHKALKEIFEFAAMDLDANINDSSISKDKLLKASAHWMRHTHGSQAVEQGVPLAILRDNMGHGSISTTSHYVHTEKDARYHAMTNI